jgi:hypothetical protein
MVTLNSILWITKHNSYDMFTFLMEPLLKIIKDIIKSQVYELWNKYVIAYYGQEPMWYFIH